MKIQAFLKITLALSFALAGALAFSATAQAQNLLSNGDFDTDIFGWSNAGFSVWTSNDRDNDPQSGSIEIPIPNLANVAATLNQCFPAAPGAEYSFGASAFIPSGGTPGVKTRVFLQFYDNPTCATSSISSTLPIAVEPVGIWIDVDDAAVAPPGTEAGFMRIGYVTPASAPGAGEVIRFDSVFVVPEPSTLLGSMAAMGALALFAGQRRRVLS